MECLSCLDTLGYRSIVMGLDMFARTTTEPVESDVDFVVQEDEELMY